MWTHLHDQIVDIGAVELARLRRHSARQIGITDDVDAVAIDHLVRHGSLTVATLLGGQIDDNTAVAHGLDHAASNQFRGRFTRNQRGRDDDINFTGLARKQFHFRGDEFFTHNLGITALAGAILLELEFEKFRIHALNLLFDLGPGIESPHDRTQRLGGADRSKSGNTGTDDQHLGGIDLAGRGNLARKETPEVMRGLDDGPITGDICHRAQGIEFLRARNSRNRIHCQHGHLALGEMLQHFFILTRPDKTDQMTAFGHQLDFMATQFIIVLRRTDLENQIT